MLLLLLTLACTESTTTALTLCEVDLASVEPTVAAPGDAAVLYGAPMTERYDTALYVGGVRADILDVIREGCDECDTCREDNACTACGDCDACDFACEASCIESVSFTVPELAYGAAPIQLFNSHGTSNVIEFELTDGSGAGDTGPGDTGTGDTGTGDTGTGDTGAR